MEFTGDLNVAPAPGHGSVSWLSVRSIAPVAEGRRSFEFVVDGSALSGGRYSTVMRLHAHQPGRAGSAGSDAHIDVPVALSYNTIGVSPAAFSFKVLHGAAGQPAPVADRSFRIEGAQLDWTASTDRNWLTLSQSAGTVAAQVSFQIHPELLANGRNVAVIKVLNAATETEDRLQIVVDATAPRMLVTPGSLEFRIDAATPDRDYSRAISVSDELGGRDADKASRWTLSFDQPWLSATATTGSSSPARLLSFSVDKSRTERMTDGRHSAIATFSYNNGDGASELKIPVALEVDNILDVDVAVYGATPGGIAAAIAAARLGKKVALIEPGQYVGGMMAGGLGHSDVYDRQVLQGLIGEFFRTVDAIYGPNVSIDKAGSEFEPHIAEQAFRQMLEGQLRVRVVHGARLQSIEKTGGEIKALIDGQARRYEAKTWVDASYEGDLLASAGVSYSTGRESSAQYGESIAGYTYPGPLGGLFVDPYRVPGNASSGLLPLMESSTQAPFGSSDPGLMAYNYRLCLSSNPANQIPFAAPAGYDPYEYELLGRYVNAMLANGYTPALGSFLKISDLPNQKYDLNASGAISTDFVGGNVGYVEGSPEARQRIALAHKKYIQGLLYFLTTDSRVPADVRQKVASLGLCKDEFLDNGGWPHQLYVREARRMVGAYVMTLADLQRQTSIPDPIGFAGYPIDSHLIHRIVKRGGAFNEGEYVRRISADPLYPISYRALTPLPAQARNLLVPVAMSASHVAYRSLRMEPTYMIMGQAAGTAAALAADRGVAVQDLRYEDLAAQLTADGQVLVMP